MPCLAHESSRDVRRAAAAVLARLDPAALALTCATPIAELLEHAEWDVRWAAVSLLASLATLPPDVLAPYTARLAARLEDSDGYVRMEAIEVFEALEPDALSGPEVAPRVVSWLTHPERVVRELAEELLPRLAHDTVALHAVTIAQTALHHDDIDIRQVSLRVLGSLAAAALRPHMDALVERLGDAEADVREAAAAALRKLDGRIDGSATEPLPAHVAVALERHEDASARWMAAGRIGRLVRAGIVPAGLCVTLALGATWYFPVSPAVAG